MLLRYVCRFYVSDQYQHQSYFTCSAKTAQKRVCHVLSFQTTQSFSELDVKPLSQMLAGPADVWEGCQSYISKVKGHSFYRVSAETSTMRLTCRINYLGLFLFHLFQLHQPVQGVQHCFCTETLKK